MAIDTKLLAALDEVVEEIKALSKAELRSRLLIAQKSVFAQTVDELISVIDVDHVWAKTTVTSTEISDSELRYLCLWQVTTKIDMSDFNFDCSNDNSYLLAA